MSAWFILLSIFLISTAAVLIGRKIGLKNAYKNREKIVLDQSITSFDGEKDIDLVIYKEVIEKIANSIKLDYGLIRSQDKLADLFGRDSWELGEGQEKFEKWLLEYAGNLPEFEKVSTVAELVLVIQQSKTKNG